MSRRASGGEGCLRYASIKAKKTCIRLKTTTRSESNLGQLHMARYRLAIFDFDGTLADSLDWFRSAIHDVIARFDLAPVDANELETFRSLSGREIMARVKVPKWRLPGIVADMRLRQTGAADPVSSVDC